MASLGQDLANAVRSGLCSALAANNALEDFVRTVINPRDPNYNYRSRLIYSRYCIDPPPPPDAPPFPGGQCNFCYAISVNFTITDSLNPSRDGTFQSNGFQWGPIRGYRLDRQGDTGISAGVGNFLFLSHGICLQPYGPLREVGLGPFTIDAGSVITVNSVTVTPRDGQPDVCGDPPPQLPDPDPDKRKFPIDFDFTYNDGTDFNISGLVFFGLAYLDVDFNLNVPLKFQLNNNVNFTGNFNLDTGDLNINFGDEFDYPVPPPPEGDYDIDPDAPQPPPTRVPPPPDFTPPFPPAEDPDEEDSEDFDDDEPQEAPKVRRIIGVLVDTITPPPFTTQLNQEVNPDVYIPDIGLVNFAYSIGGTRLYWGEDIRVKNLRQVIFTPSGRYAVAVSGTIRQGGEWILTPIYATVVESVGV